MGEVNQCFKKQCKEDKADIREQMGSQPTETKNNAKLCVFLLSRDDKADGETFITGPSHHPPLKDHCKAAFYVRAMTFTFHCFAGKVKAMCFCS